MLAVLPPHVVGLAVPVAAGFHGIAAPAAKWLMASFPAGMIVAEAAGKKTGLCVVIYAVLLAACAIFTNYLHYAPITPRIWMPVGIEIAALASGCLIGAIAGVAARQRRLFGGDSED